MHELGITRNIIAIVSERANNRKVQRVKLQIGKLSAIEPEAIRFCFDVCSEGTNIEGAILEIEEIDGRASCNACKRQMNMSLLAASCDCGSLDIECIAGKELLIKEMEVR